MITEKVKTKYQFLIKKIYFKIHLNSTLASVRQMIKSKFLINFQWFEIFKFFHAEFS